MTPLIHTLYRSKLLKVDSDLKWESIAANLLQLGPKAAQATQFVSTSGNGCYGKIIEKNKGYIQDPPRTAKCNGLLNSYFTPALQAIRKHEAFKAEVDSSKDYGRTGRISKLTI